MNKDYIIITLSDGSTEKMEVVATFRLEETSKDCIIYKSINNQKYYAASYNTDSDYSNLDTNFSESEKEQLNKIFNKLKLGGDLNA